MQNSIFIGLDVHKATISVAVAQGERRAEVRHLGTIPHRPGDVRKLVGKLSKGGRELHFCYEAGPCGYGLHRQLLEMDQDCIVVAPSLIPVKAGDRVKTDRRDAIMLAKLHRAGELTAAYRRWLTTVRFQHPAQQIVLQDYIDAIADAEARVAKLTGQIAELLRQWKLAPVVEAVQAMRGVAFIVAVTVVAEVGDFHRFNSPRQLMAYVVCSSSGPRPSCAGGLGTARPGGSWMAQMLATKPKMLVAVALANKIARVAWALMRSDGVYRAPATA
ncbi:hypothetical protein C9E82_05435 [Paracoccus siganidrum]|uniref:Transposase n=1 Tax=Paracoccus siganidrum TaxID=1276757 RepID=A0A418ZZC1_9RHOB|nr:transposase [Paracoccus siganidrum]RMC38791.1 hypothetical protein C9E82_05435 [Paracoccus siganidrum]